MESAAENKSKVKFLLENIHYDWKPMKRQPYLEKLNRKQASTLFQTRTRMLKVKENYKTKYQTNLMCRACGLFEETQNHILNECKKLHETNETRTNPNNPFHLDPVI